MLLSKRYILNAAEIEPEELDMKKNWLRHNREPRATVRQYMGDTRASRLAWIHQHQGGPTINEVLAAYPRLGDGDGWIWVSCLFSFLATNPRVYQLWYLSGNLKKWQDLFGHLKLEFAPDGLQLLYFSFQ